MEKESNPSDFAARAEHLGGFDWDREPGCMLAGSLWPVEALFSLIFILS